MKESIRTIERKSNNLIDNLHRQGIITQTEKKKLTIYNAVPPKFYCLPKIHKDGIPLRPIVSCVGAPFYNPSS